MKCGYVALIGRPNVGKSTLINTVIGEKVSIVTEKPQTTRNRITGIKNLPNAQIIFIDTPGIHKPRHKLGEFMVKEAQEAMDMVDLIVFMVEPEAPGNDELSIIERLKKLNKPVILAINKIDTVAKQNLLPLIELYNDLHPFQEIIPISALKKDGIERLVERIIFYLPDSPILYPEDMLTDQAERFMVAEFIREKIMKYTHDEIPYSVAVDIERWEETEKLISIGANIYVEREGQKIIIIGKKGERLKKIATEARLDIEKFLGTKIFLEVWVKVRKKWRQKDMLLKSLGY
ncbi:MULTISPECIES: GTPase Era [Thermodesulfovibrio]|uniref:GTPase Era n=1 Tax=Thermodesulfovibrio yellowstonii (strain ATCC 51303 / DSM 11347 / YP87) TaxID=289376 RepID=B5YIN1_THEYD|nr:MULTISPECIES: GTPase Era [Thermodesulfovibrio]ACI22071.1 GTP-binding protein Era [Thermodesulfovibrio yellowstonii DSM 11347]